MDMGYTINRPPRDGHMAFVRSPDKISIEILQEGNLEPKEPWASMEIPALGKSMKKKILDIIKKKNKSKIVSLTAYSKNVASILDNFCDIILVGDSLGSVLYNYKSTREVSLKTMIEHSKSVRMGIKKSLMVVDMPHNTYRNAKEALKNAKKIMSETKSDAVKLEGGKKIYKIVELLTKNNIPVMGHLGLLPQSEKTFKFKGKKISERNKILKDAELLQSAGAFSIVLECVETSLSKMVTKKISIPTIGIGASNNCDGQILVFDDLIGLNPINVRFVKKYSNIRKEMTKAVASYAKEVKNNKFPLKKHSY